MPIAACVMALPLSLYQKGPNRTPVAAICLTSLLTLAFIFIGQVNVLAPIVSINFMLTYSFIDYTYFSVAMTFQLQRKEKRVSLVAGKVCHRRSSRPGPRPLIEVMLPNYGSSSKTLHLKGTLLEFTKDMDQMFPSNPNVDHGVNKTSVKHLHRQSRRAGVSKKQKLMDSFGLDLNSNVFSEEKADEASSTPSRDAPLQEDRPAEETQIRLSQTHQEQRDSSGKPQVLRRCSAINTTTQKIHLTRAQSGSYLVLCQTFSGAESKTEQQNFEIKAMRDSFYTKFCNRWVALFGVGLIFKTTI